MKKWLPVLGVLLVLGECISIAQGTADQSPFDRYLIGVRNGEHEAALLRTATRCGLSLKTANVHNAERPSETWKLVRNLSHARDDQETDFFATVQVWHSHKKILVEEWNMDSEAGDEVRTLYCLQNRQVIYGEQIEWSSGLTEEEEKENTCPDWAYEVRWEVIQGKFFKSILERFVNEQEKTVPKPKLGPHQPTVFGVIPEIKNWGDFNLPNELLK